MKTAVIMGSVVLWWSAKDRNTRQTLTFAPAVAKGVQKNAQTTKAALDSAGKRAR